jgi:hypothetical protein
MLVVYNTTIMEPVLPANVTAERVQALLRRAEYQKHIQRKYYHAHREEIAERRREKRREENPNPRPRGRPRKVDSGGMLQTPQSCGLNVVEV